MGAVRRSVLFSAADKYLGQLFAVGTMAAMARLLTPAETGLYLVAAGVLVLVEGLRDFGVATYIVQQAELSSVAMRTAFTVTLALSLGLAACLWLSADAIAALFGEPELALLLRTGTIGFLLVPFGTPLIGLLRRDLAFRTLAVLNVANAAATALVTLVLGARGFGPVSHVWGTIAGNAVATVLAVRARPFLWIFRPSLADWRRLASFGALSSAVILLNMAFDLLPRFALGRILGFDAVGLYGRALALCQIPDRLITSALSPVVLPAFAARVRARGDLRDAYLRGVTLITAMQWPILLVVALLAEPIVAVVLGAQWGGAAALTRVMAVSTMALAPAFLTFPLLVAVGRIRDTLVASLISLPPSFLLLCTMAPFGLDAVAAGLLVTAPLQMAVAYHFVRRALDLGWGDLWRAAAPSVPMAVGSILAPLALLALQPGGAEIGLPGAAAAAAGAGLGWLVAGLSVGHPLTLELLHLAEALAVRVRRRA